MRTLQRRLALEQQSFSAIVERTRAEMAGDLLEGTDVRVAAESATFGVSEVKWSLYPMGGSAVRLARQIPYARAMEILMTGRDYSAQQALDWGLINYYFSADCCFSIYRIKKLLCVK